MSDADLRRKLSLLKQKKEIEESLPHLYGRKMYPWMRDFFETKNRKAVLVAANQLGKSSTMIRKVIHWATSPEMWGDLWPSRPRQFWYFYPKLGTATKEFEEKWIPEWLPRGKMVDHPVYGWKAHWDRKDIASVEFNSGITIYFMSYEMRPQNVQASTVHVVALDEEAPVELLDELRTRTSAPTVLGHMMCAFTATTGQLFWQQVIEGKGDNEQWPDAWKKRVSLYDCLKYEDGSQSPWTLEIIHDIEKSCKSQREIDIRVNGLFGKAENLKYPLFDRDRHLVASHKLPSDWQTYVGIDGGSGGNNHPAAITFVKVSPDFTKGRVVNFWIGDKNTVTSNGDVFNKYLELKMQVGHPLRVFYDASAADLGIIASRSGESFEQADKKHETGENILNTLFKFDALKIYDDYPAEVLAHQFESLRTDQPKNKAYDDGVDATRYAVSKLPWDFQKITGNYNEEPEPIDLRTEREKSRRGVHEYFKEEIDQEFSEWAPLYEL